MHESKKAKVLIIIVASAIAMMVSAKKASTGDWWINQAGDGTANAGVQAGTAGDIASNIFSDAYDGVTSMFSNWPSGSSPYKTTITDAANNNGVPVEILAWTLWKESRYNPQIIDGTRTSPAGAIGIAQFMPETAVERLGSTQAALDPEQAIPGAASYLRDLYNATGTWTKALAAYNWGIGNVKRKGLAAAPAETVDYYSTILAKSNAGGEQYA